MLIKNKKDLISIIVPIYNISKYLCKCIDSIIDQSYTNIEIILVDDGSTDDSAFICDNYLKKDYRVNVIHKKNEGLVKARKDGVAVATGDYVLYVDGDDWIESNMVEKMYQTLVDERVDVVMCARFEDTGDIHKTVCQGIPKGRYNKKKLMEYVYPNMLAKQNFFEWGLFPSVWDKLFKRETLIPFQNQVDDKITMGEDALCTYPYLLNVNSIYILDDYLYHYRQTPTSMVHQHGNSIKERAQFRLLYNEGKRLFEKYAGIYDLREQWKKYILFLMIPRADILYDKMEQISYLYPYPDVKKYSKIVLYGAGLYGQRLYSWLQKTRFCKVVALVDQNWKELSKQGRNIDSPELIDDLEFDYIIITCSFAMTRDSIYKYLLSKNLANKVKVMDEKLVMDAFDRFEII